MPRPASPVVLEPLLSVAELAALTGHTVPTVYEWRRTGRAPRAVRVGKKVMFRREDVAAWLEQHADTPGA